MDSPLWRQATRSSIFTLCFYPKQEASRSGSFTESIISAGRSYYWAMADICGVIVELGDHRISENVHTGDQKT